MTERPSAFRGIRHVAFRVTNLEECEEFYKEVMGMELLYRANENLVYLTCGNDNLSLARVDEASKEALEEMGLIGWLAAAAPGGKMAQGLAQTQAHDHFPFFPGQVQVVVFDRQGREPG